VGANSLKVTKGALLGPRAWARTRGNTGNVEITAERVHVSGGSSIDTSTAAQTSGKAGRVAIKADTLEVDGGRIQAVTHGAGNAGVIDLHVGQLTVTGGGQIDSGARSGSTGQGGTVTVRATEAVSIAEANSGLFSTTAGAGNAGAITLEAERLTLTDGAVMSGTTLGPGRGGSVTVKATKALTLAGTDPMTGSPSGIFAEAQGRGQGAGDAGAVLVEAATITLTDGAIMSGTTLGPGRGGSVTVRATEAVTLEGPGTVGRFASGIFASAQGVGQGVGDAGTVLVEAATVTLTDGAQIGSTTFGSGRGGSVTVRATEAVTLKGFTLVGSAFIPAGISAITLGAGDAGAVLVEAATVTLTDGAQISSGTFALGGGGSVTVRATEAVTLEGSSLEGSFLAPSSITALTFRAGDAGAVLVEAATVTLTNGAQIRSGTFGLGRGGSVTVRATEAVTLGSPSPVGRFPVLSGLTAMPIGPGGTVALTATDIVPARLANGLLTDARGSGPGGDLTLQARTAQLRDGATIAASSTGTGNAGNITITVTDTFRSERSTVTTEALHADGGNIQMTAPSMVRLRDSTITATVGGGPETIGGNITIDPAFVILANSQIIANAFAGRGGNIDITAGVMLADPASRVSASSTLGISGAVDIRAPVTELSGTVAPLPQAFVSAAALLRERCAQRLRAGHVSSFVLAGRDGVPAEPDSGLPSLLVAVELPPPDTPEPDGQMEKPSASSAGLQQAATRGQLQISGWQGPAFAPVAVNRECALQRRDR
jgi:large exoprotein involved in heme utilization and adhesion